MNYLDFRIIRSGNRFGNFSDCEPKRLGTFAEMVLNSIDLAFNELACNGTFDSLISRIQLRRVDFTALTLCSMSFALEMTQLTS